MIITIYGQPDCSFCAKAKAFCVSRKLSFDYVDISISAETKREFLLKTKFAKTVPQIFVNQTLIGGFEVFTEAVQNGLLSGEDNE